MIRDGMAGQDISKETLIAQCQRVLSERMERLALELERIQESVASDTKSSAGDKYETAREMSNLEKQKIQEQLHQIEKEQMAVERVPLHPINQVQHGALVETSMGTFFIAASLGKIGEGLPFVVSAAAPVCRAMWGKKSGDNFTFNDKKVLVLTIN